MHGRCLMPRSNFETLARRKWAVVKVSEDRSGNHVSCYRLHLESRWLFWTSKCKMIFSPGQLDVSFRVQYLADYPDVSFQATDAGGLLVLKNVGMTEGGESDLHIQFFAEDSETSGKVKEAIDFLDPTLAIRRLRSTTP